MAILEAYTLLRRLGIDPDTITQAAVLLNPGEPPRIRISYRIAAPSSLTWHVGYVFDHPTQPLHLDALCAMAGIAVLATVNAATERHLKEMHAAAEATRSARNRAEFFALLNAADLRRMATRMGGAA